VVKYAGTVGTQKWVMYECVESEFYPMKLKLQFSRF